MSHIIGRYFFSSSEESVGHRYGRMVLGSSAREAGEPIAGGASTFFVASCLSSQFDLPGKRYAVREYQSGTGPLLIEGRNTAT